jgi:hypothetical protein
MNLGGITREQKLLGAAIANALFVVSLFLKWTGLDTPVGDFSQSGNDVDSWWLVLIIALIATAVFAAEFLRVELPAIAGIPLATYLTSLTAFYSVVFLLALDNLKFGIFLALIFSVVGTVLAVSLWREER